MLFFVVRRSVGVCLFLLISTISAQLHALPTLADYAADSNLHSVSISPSGQRLAFRERKNGIDVIRIVDLEKQKTLVNFDVSDINPNDIYFIDENRVIVRATDNKKRVRGFKGRLAISSAFIISISKNKIRQLLTPGEVIYKLQTGLGRIVAVSENKEFAYMPAFVKKRSSDFRSGSTELMLMKVSLAIGSGRPSIESKGVKNAIDYFVGQDGSVLAVESYNPNSHLYQVRVPDGRGWREIYSDNSDLREFSISGLTPDRKSLVLVNENDDTGFDSVYTMSLTDGKISNELFNITSKDIDSLLIDINQIVYGVRYSGFTPRYAFFDATLSARIAKIQSMFQGESVFLTSSSPDWKQLVVMVEGSFYAGDYFMIHGDQAPDFVGTSRRQIEVDSLHPIIQTAYTARDGMKIPLLLTIPRNKQNDIERLPAVMMPHGGPESYDSVGFDWLAQSLANEGYLVIQPQFRGSSGFGSSHLLAGRGEWGKKMQSDLLDGVNTLAKQNLIDKDKVCIVGWSYGGYAALAGGAFNNPAYKCVVAVNGVADLNLMMKSEKKENNNYLDVYAYWNQVIKAGELSKDDLNAISPVKHAANFEVPTLIIYGDEDEVVLPVQSKKMVKALKEAGKAVEVLRIKKEGHSFTDPKSRQETLESIVKFLKQSLKNK